jgi:hypothetical protein
MTELWKRLHHYDRHLQKAFDDLRRSTALLRLRQFRALGLLEPEEIARLGEESRRFVEFD